MDPERKGWSAELLAMVQTAGGTNGSDGQEGIQFKELDIDQAQKSTGAFGWTFKGAHKNVAKITYGLQKAEKLRQQKRKERREAQLRLQGQDRDHGIALAQSHASVAQREQERANARFAMERAQCLCPLSRLPMRWPVVAAGALRLSALSHFPHTNLLSPPRWLRTDGFVYERVAISQWLDQKVFTIRFPGIPSGAQTLTNARIAAGPVLACHRAAAAERAAHPAPSDGCGCGGGAV